MRSEHFINPFGLMVGQATYILVPQSKQKSAAAFFETKRIYSTYKILSFCRYVTARNAFYTHNASHTIVYTQVICMNGNALLCGHVYGMHNRVSVEFAHKRKQCARSNAHARCTRTSPDRFHSRPFMCHYTLQTCEHANWLPKVVIVDAAWALRAVAHKGRVTYVYICCLCALRKSRINYNQQRMTCTCCCFMASFQVRSLP